MTSKVEREAHDIVQHLIEAYLAGGQPWDDFFEAGRSEKAADRLAAVLSEIRDYHRDRSGKGKKTG